MFLHSPDAIGSWDAGALTFLLWNRDFFVEKTTGMWDEDETTDTTAKMFKGSRFQIPQNKKETNHPGCILGDGPTDLLLMVQKSC